MRTLLLTVLVLGVCFGSALGDVKCFLTKLSNCSSTAVGMTFSAPTPGVDFCKNYNEYFDCARELQKECSTHYDLNGVERMYGRICTNGTFLNKLSVKYGGCILKSIQGHLSCYQDIIDYAKKFKVITPDVLFEITKLACKERRSINRCIHDSIKEDCGTIAKIFIELVSFPSEKANIEICRDVLRPDQE